MGRLVDSVRAPRRAPALTERQQRDVDRAVLAYQRLWAVGGNTARYLVLHGRLERMRLHMTPRELDAYYDAIDAWRRTL